MPDYWLAEALPAAGKDSLLGSISGDVIYFGSTSETRLIGHRVAMRDETRSNRAGELL